MQTIALQPVRLAPAPMSTPVWRPAPLAPTAVPPVPRRAVMGQVPGQAPPATAAAPTGPMMPRKELPFIDSALVATILDFTGVFTSGYLAYWASRPGVKNVKASPWAYVYGAVALGLAIKGVVDMNYIRER